MEKRNSCSAWAAQSQASMVPSRAAAPKWPLLYEATKAAEVTLVPLPCSKPWQPQWVYSDLRLLFSWCRTKQTRVGLCGSGRGEILWQHLPPFPPPPGPSSPLVPPPSTCSTHLSTPCSTHLSTFHLFMPCPPSHIQRSLSITRRSYILPCAPMSIGPAPTGSLPALGVSHWRKSAIRHFCNSQRQP